MTNSFRLSEGEVRVWIEQESIHIVARTKVHNDPVELTEEEALSLAKAIEQLVQEIRSKDS